MIVFEKLQQVTEMITILPVCSTRIISGYYKMIAIDLSKQKALDFDRKAMQRINFSGCLAFDGDTDATIFFIIEDAKETILDFSQGTV